MQLEVGENVTDYEHISFAEELRRCERYFATTYPHGLQMEMHEHTEQMQVMDNSMLMKIMGVAVDILLMEYVFLLK